MGNIFSRRSVLVGGLLAGAFLSTPAPAEGERLVVTTAHGPVRGVRQGDLIAFKGVRYGADTSVRRFEKPARPTRWKEPLDAIDTGMISADREDCLFVDVYTPAIGDGRRRPVLIYGANGRDDVRRRAITNDAVVIMVNRRRGALGHLYLPLLLRGAFPDSGNAGAWDLVLALEWVRENAAAFGGDPHSIFIYNDTSDAAIASLASASAAKGLYWSMLSITGAPLKASGPLNATRRSQPLLESIGLTYCDRRVLQELPAKRLLEGMNAADPLSPQRSLEFGTVIDGRLLERHPLA